MTNTELKFFCKWCNTRKSLNNFTSSPCGYMNKKTKCKACTKIFNKERYLRRPHYTKKIKKLKSPVINKKKLNEST